MTEDRSFNEFVRAKLEADVGEIPAVAIPGRPGPAYLLAASVAAICCAFAVRFANVGDESCEQAAIMAIELLDVDSVTAVSADYTERLLAWQDVPFVEIGASGLPRSRIQLAYP